MSMHHVEGILTVTATPFQKGGGSIDFEAYARLLDFVTGNGVHYVVPCGTTGEYYNLTTDERKQVFKFVAETIGGRAKLFAGTNSSRPAEIIDLSLYAKDLGYEGLMLAAPYYSLPTTQELVAHFKAIDDAVQLPILLYNFPARTGVDMSPEFLRGIKDRKRIFGIKESSGSMARMHELMSDFSDQVQLVCGADDQAFEYFAWGVRAWVAGASNFLPAEHVALYEACIRRNDLDAGREIMRRLMPVFMLMEQGGKYLQYNKYGCELAGVPVGETRAPMLPLTAEEKKAFRKLYERATAATPKARVAAE
ncbi:MAG: dihydrodipicolinate synthase family protein [Methylobacteriaceae bacterium]|nr:dihydrodipicolinate synthase family protein [Methylobacteriaceae bacterium]